MKTKQSSGFTLVEIMIVIVIIGLLAAIAVPNFMKARSNSQMNQCVANLKLIEGAKNTWEDERQATNNPTPGDLFGKDLYIIEMPKCPAGGTYTLNKLGENPSCSIVSHGLPQQW